MTKTSMKMTYAIKAHVSNNRKRYKDDGFNLDLTIITPNIIAMGFPANGVETFFRNSAEEVKQFLNLKHPNNYRVYNLCSEKTYDSKIFEERVVIYPFDDHNPPAFQLIIDCCNDMQNWLSDPNHVAAVHCKAGKGRTGTMIGCYLIHSGKFKTAMEALTHYATKRTTDKKGVTIPSQRRYVDYYARYIANNQIYIPTTIYLTGIKIKSMQGYNKISVSISSMREPSNSSEVTPSSPNHVNELISKKIEKLGKDKLYVFSFDDTIKLTGDIKFELEITKNSLVKKRTHFWLNTYFVKLEHNSDNSNNFRYILRSSDLDDKQACLPTDFEVHLQFCSTPQLERSYNGILCRADVTSGFNHNNMNNSNSSNNHYQSQLNTVNQKNNHHHKKLELENEVIYDNKLRQSDVLHRDSSVLSTTQQTVPLNNIVKKSSKNSASTATATTLVTNQSQHRGKLTSCDSPEGTTSESSTGEGWESGECLFSIELTNYTPNYGDCTGMLSSDKVLDDDEEDDDDDEDDVFCSTASHVGIKSIDGGSKFLYVNSDDGYNDDDTDLIKISKGNKTECCYEHEYMQMTNKFSKFAFGGPYTYSKAPPDCNWRSTSAPSSSLSYSLSDREQHELIQSFNQKPIMYGPSCSSSSPQNRYSLTPIKKTKVAIKRTRSRKLTGFKWPTNLQFDTKLMEHLSDISKIRHSSHQHLATKTIQIKNQVRSISPPMAVSVPTKASQNIDSDFYSAICDNQLSVGTLPTLIQDEIKEMSNKKHLSIDSLNDIVND